MLHENADAIIEFAQKSGLKDVSLVFLSAGQGYELRGKGTIGKSLSKRQLVWDVAEKCGIFSGCGYHSAAQVWPERFKLPACTEEKNDKA